MSLLQMSFAGAAIILTVTVIRAVGMNKLPKTAFLVLWGLALVRLLIPYAVPAAFSVYSLWNRFAAAGEVPGSTFSETTAGNIIAVSPVQDLIPGASAPAAQAVSLSAPKIDPWVLIWIIGMLTCAMFFTVSYFRCRREFTKSLPVDNDVSGQWLETHRLNRRITIRYSDRISAPLTYGIFRPVILMPKATDWNDLDSLQYVLTHEYVHICRFDAVTKLLLTAALCIHWFNPAVWLMYVLANRDIELACDEAVVRQFGERTKAAYAMTLIRMEESRSGLSPLCNSFSKNAIEERIVAIMKLKKPSMAALLTAAAVIVGVTCGFATSAQATSSKTADEKTTDIFPNAAQVTGESTAISYADPRDGKTYYSWDSGITWTPMTDEEFDAVLTPSDIEWWTAEDYAAWLEEEKEALRSIIGERGWTSSTGWFTWDQKMVDETIAAHEQILRDIKNGLRISKPSPDMNDLAVNFSRDEAGNGTESDDTGGYDNQDVVVHMTKYSSVGVMFLNHNGNIYWNDQLVHILVDQMPDGTSLSYSSSDEGGINIQTVYDSEGKLTGLELIKN